MEKLRQIRFTDSNFDAVERKTEEKEENEDVSVFDKIVAGEIPATILYQDDLCLAIRDINP